MRRIVIILFFIIIPFYLFGAAYEDIGSVRAKGMGEAIESISAGIDAIRYNPAGAAYTKSLQVYSSFNKPAVGFDDGTSILSFNAGVTVPFSNKPYLIFLNYLFKGLTIGNEKYVMRDGSFSFMFYQFSVLDFAYERLITFNIAKSLNNFLEGANMSFGVNFNIFNRGYTPTEDTIIHPDSNLKDSSTGFGIDVGMTYDFSKFIRLSLVMLNILPPNISFFSDSTEYVNQQLKLGIAWRLGDIWKLQDFVASGGYEQISRDSDDNRKAESVYKIGTEFWEWKHRIGIRFGYQTSYNVLSVGVSYNHKFKINHNVTFNYAFNYPMTSKNYKHYFNLNYSFDFPDYYFDYRTDEDIAEEARMIENNFRKGVVVIKYKTLPNDNLYNISLIFYSTPKNVDTIKQFNKLKDDKNLPKIIDIPYNAKDFQLYKVKTGDTLESVSKKIYGTEDKIPSIRKYNKIEFSRLRRGKILILPIIKGMASTTKKTKTNRLKKRVKSNLKSKQKAK